MATMSSILMRFPQGKEKAVTFSYDDGVEQDVRLLKIFKDNGLKATFNINSALYADEGTVYPSGQIHRRMTKSQALELYKNSGMEVAVHTLTHPHLEELPTSVCINEVLQDRMNLEQDFGGIVRGMAYPYGTFNDDVVDILRHCGVAYARTTISSGKFAVPTDWLRLCPTCHHKDARLMELADEFVNASRVRKAMLFYVWGHSYEFEQYDNWEVMENFAQFIGGRDDIWYATNIEIYDYVSAYKRLVFSANGKTVYNPTTITLYFKYDDKVFSVEPNQTLNFGD